eukprot:TRINITY_DN5339_c0_g1_i1.p1 TRINITY_DN5339_c0_g1~~TRINITY_DN5339_c0_g1_i1.p1  ORF type:complete len:313 (+),score=38.10 TRINITY_DN5339_c0_g1_i1:131-1069(+)
MAAYEYVDDVPDTLQCPCCLAALVEPVVTRCNHTFCDACVGSQKVCPVCRAAVNQEHLRKEESPIVLAMLGSLRVMCPNAPGGCDWQGPRDNVSAHLNSCRVPTVAAADSSALTRRIVEQEARIQDLEGQVAAFGRITRAVEILWSAKYGKCQCNLWRMVDESGAKWGPTSSQGHASTPPLCDSSICFAVCACDRKPLCSACAAEVERMLQGPLRSYDSCEAARAGLTATMISASDAAELKKVRDELSEIKYIVGLVCLRGESSTKMLVTRDAAIQHSWGELQTRTSCSAVTCHQVRFRTTRLPGSVTAAEV